MTARAVSAVRLPAVRGRPPSLSRRRAAWLLCLIGVTWYLAVGHAIHPPTDSMGLPELGICLVLVTAVAAVALRRPEPLVELMFTGGERWPPTAAAVPLPRPAARASPAWLQRFLR
jgi:hypothetical protein